MRKNIFVISDIELGRGDIFDDFKDEPALLSFIKKITNEPGKNILVLNGDIFDFLKMPYKDRFTHHISEDMSLWKMNQVIETYPKIFQALREFLQKSPNKIHFNIGNHDIELLWPEVQKRLKEELGNINKISIAEIYENTEVHIEHGHQIDYFYKMDTAHPFIMHKGQKLLSLPLGNIAVIRYFIELKRHFPMEESVYPRHMAFENFPEFRRMKQKIAINFILKGILFHFITSIGDPVSNVPYLNLIKHIFAHGLEVYDEAKFSRKRFKNMAKLYPDKKVYVMGHMHLTHHDIHPTNDQVHIITDTWREESLMSKGTKIPKAKTYAKIVYENDRLIKVDLLTYAS